MSREITMASMEFGEQCTAMAYEYDATESGSDDELGQLNLN